MEIIAIEPNLDLLARCAAAVDSCGDDSYVCLLTAARAYRVWLPPVPDEIEIAAAEPGAHGREMVRTRHQQLRAHRRQLDDVDRAVICGVPITSPARTWVDIAALLTLPDLVAAGDSILRGGTTVDELAEVVSRSRRHRGVRSARLALPLLDVRSRSRPESHLRVAVSAPDLPRWEVNVPIPRRDGGWLAEPDLSLAEARIALEYQGADHSDTTRMRKDITRGVDVRREGWLSLLYGPAEVFGRPWQILPEVRSLVRERAPHVLGPRRRSPSPR